MELDEMGSQNLVLLGIATTCLYSTGHWIGATALLLWAIWAIIEAVK